MQLIIQKSHGKCVLTESSLLLTASSSSLGRALKSLSYLNIYILNNLVEEAAATSTSCQVLGEHKTKDLKDVEIGL